MMESAQKHLVLVRHGESEGDRRRAAAKNGVIYDTGKHPRDEEQTETGHKEMHKAGMWIAKHILARYGLVSFDGFLVSPQVRTVQSAHSLGLPGDWLQDARLAERDRGKVQGMTQQQHQEQYPDSYRSMVNHPFHWTPPGGESLLRVADRVDNLVRSLPVSGAYIFMTHRDVMWAAHMPLDGLGLEAIELVKTDAIGNGHIFHYTNVNPHDGRVASDALAWRQSVDPCGPDSNSEGVWSEAGAVLSP